MRNNQPVTQKEFEFPDHATLMSTTDTASHVTYANDAFIDVSGFSKEEIHGQPHNLVRHPDMPQQAFADMWATLKGGEPWTALVKNRRKNGDHYWVRANATPVIRDGKTSGYMSVRTKASRDEIEAAEALYRDFREGRAGNKAFHKGLIVRRGLGAWRSIPQTLSVRGRIRAASGLLAACVLAGGWALGLSDTAVEVFMVLFFTVLLMSTLWLEWQIARPLEELHAHALGIVTGERRENFHMNRVDEIGMTLRTITQLGLMFRWVIDDVSGQILNVQTATNEIAAGNNDLSTRTEQAAASVEQTASSMEQMASTVGNTADTATHANVLSGSASMAAAKGGQAVSEVVGTMNEINQSSRRIGDIIGVIDGIAFQTNILALNAAVEAARAGEQGRGFAVVASEVRSLAHRSAGAAKEIKALIGASAEKVEAGSRLVDDAGKAMDDIVCKVKQVSDLIAQISASTLQQNQGISQVGDAVGHLDQITQQNAALVEQSAAASESLKSQTARLADAVRVFRSSES